MNKRILSVVLALCLLTAPLFTNTLFAARDFDGTNDHRVELTDADDLDLTGGVLTLCAWIYPESFGESSQGRIIDKGGASVSSGYSLQLDDVASAARMQYWVNNDTGVVSDNGAITLNVWQHVCFTQTGPGVGTFYVDGVDVGGGTGLVDPTAGATAVRIGLRATDLLREFDGRIAEVAIWSRVLTAGERSTLLVKSPAHVSGANRVAYLRLGGISDPEPDLFGLGHSGAVTGAVVGDHPPIGSPFGFDFGWFGAFGAAAPPAFRSAMRGPGPVF